jgi:hypothetical protein
MPIYDIRGLKKFERVDLPHANSRPSPFRVDPWGRPESVNGPVLVRAGHKILKTEPSYPSRSHPLSVLIRDPRSPTSRSPATNPLPVTL